MRKLLMALALLAGSLLAMPMSAQAAHPSVTIPSDCTQYSGSVGGSYWPYVPSGKGYMYYCAGATVQHASLVFSVIAANNNANFITTQMRNNGGVFFVYPNWTAYYNDLHSQGATQEAAGTYGVTVSKGTTTVVPYFSAIVENNGVINVSNTQMQTTTAHELGHWLDELDASIVGGTGTASSSSFFNNSLNDVPGSYTGDWYVFNRITPCKTGSPAGNFNGQQDPHNLPTYYCTGTNGNGAALQSQYGSLSPELLIQDAYPGVFNKGNAEIFAEELPVWLGYRNDGSGTSVNDWDHFLDPGVNTTQFQCTENIVYYLFFYGTTPQNYPSGCRHF